MEIVSSWKYLGVVISDKMNDSSDISRQIRGLYVQGNSIIRCFRHCTSDVKVLLFKTFCSSFYCPHLWSSFSAEYYRRLKVAYNRIFRYMFNVTEYNISISGMMLDYNVKTFDAVIRNYIFSFIQRMSTCDNGIIKAVMNSVFYYSSIIFKHWKDKLYLLSD